jgi:hypothetical protein
LNNRACGAYKLICWLYRPRGWHIHHIDRMIDTTLALQSERGDFGDSGFGCQVFDPLLLLKVGRDRRPGYRRNDVDAAAARCYLTLNDHWDPDHGFFKNAHGEVRLNNMVELPIALYMAELLLGISYFDADRCNE